MRIDKNSTIFLPVEVRAGRPVSFEVLETSPDRRESRVAVTGGCELKPSTPIAICSESECASVSPCPVWLGDGAIGNFTAPIGSKGSLSPVPKLERFWVRATFEDESGERFVGVGVAKAGDRRLLVREGVLAVGDRVTLPGSIDGGIVRSVGAFKGQDGCCWAIADLDRASTKTINEADAVFVSVQPPATASFVATKSACGIFAIHIPPSQAARIPRRGLLTVSLEQGWSRDRPTWRKVVRSERYTVA
jgi:hypothetical protein